MMYATKGSTVSWQEMEEVISFVDNIQGLFDNYHARPYGGLVVPLAHTLNRSNIRKKLLVRSVLSFILFMYYS